MGTPKLSEKRKCGHCGYNAPMVLGGEFRDSNVENLGGYDFNYGKCYELLKCQSCDGIELRYFDFHDCFDDHETEVKYITVYPKQIKMPEGLPRKVKAEYIEALNGKKGNLNGYGVALGRVLETVLQDKKAKGKMLGQQLRDLAERNLLPKETLDSANALNEFRKIGAHITKGKLTKREIPIMERLTKSILEYVYSAPYMMKQAEKASVQVDKKNSPKKPIPYPPIRRVMVKQIPQALFVEISIYDTDYEQEFFELAKRGTSIKYQLETMPNVPDS